MEGKIGGPFACLVSGEKEVRKAAGLLPPPTAVSVSFGSRGEEDLPENTTDRANLFLFLLSLQLGASSLFML